MLYFIDDSVVKAAEDGIETVLIRLNDLYYCWEKGLCIIGSSRKNFIRLNSIKGIGNYGLVQKTSQGIQSLYTDLDFFVILIHNQNLGHSLSKFTGKYRELEITSFNGILDWSLNFVVCENVTDFYFYAWLTEQKKRNLQSHNYRINILPFNGGGNTTVASLKYIQNHFCLVICDSDVKYEGCQQGDTCGSVKDYVAELSLQEKNTIWMHILGVHEVENLIPLDIMEFVFRKNAVKKLRDILSKQYGDIFLSFFDFKEGFKESVYRKLKNMNYNVFQKYEQLFLDIGKTDKYLKKILRRKYKKGQDNCIVNGFGADVLSNVVMYIENNVISSNDYKIENYQSADWNDISRKIWSLGCAMTPKHL